ncbi:MAG: type II toxin-antitoxin system death-on-curing family toxin [Bryobacterales bacterium]|nr:type II toxin-antitoxin system death-on-curing family toxin [Bryobacterales bacterium]
MKKRQQSVAQLASEAGKDIDEVLILLWDEGFDDAKDADSIIPRKSVDRARHVLGLGTQRQIGTRKYWKTELGLDAEEEVDELLHSLGIRQLKKGKYLSRKAIQALKKNRLKSIPSTNWEKSIDSEIRPVKRDLEYETLEWSTIGREKELVLLKTEDVSAIHEQLAEDYCATSDPIDPPGIRSRDLLESAVSRPSTSLLGERKYPTVEMATAALFHSLVHNHPFHNGNKRTAVVSMLVALDRNGLMLTCTGDDLFKLVLQLAKHELTVGPDSEIADREVLTVARWLFDSSRDIVKGERPLQWRKLKQILTPYGCRFEPREGNKIAITRRVIRSTRFFRRTRSEILKTIVNYAGDGTDAAKNTVHKIRSDLNLDEKNGIDSASFYSSQPASASEFILKYKGILNRLSKL